MQVLREERTSNEAGFSLGEIALVLGIMGILTAVATPMFLRYYNTAQLTVAAREVATTLNHGRQLAISQNAVICVHNTSTALHFHQGGCAGAAWVGPGTDASGNIALPAGITLASTANPQFTYLGAASPGATYTVRHTQTNTTATVVVAGSGRITVQ
jgi:Tfp pilus assembly protein FimT